jgi:hypothetical protein
MGRKKKKGKFVRTTISLPYEIWEKLRIESIKTKTPMGDLIASKIKELEKLQKKLRIVKD